MTWERHTQREEITHCGVAERRRESGAPRGTTHTLRASCNRVGGAFPTEHKRAVTVNSKSNVSGNNNTTTQSDTLMVNRYIVQAHERKSYI